MLPEQASAVADLRSSFPDSQVTALEQPDGRVFVTLAGVAVGVGWNVDRSDLATFLEVTYPTTPPYPFYAVVDLHRADGNAVAGLTPSAPVGSANSSQLSLRHDYTPGEGLGARFAAVIRWLRTRA
jgi:hypothetical protein